MSWSSCQWCSAQVASWDEYVSHVNTVHPNGDPELRFDDGLAAPTKEESGQ